MIQRIAPSGIITASTIRFQWQSDPNAGWYHLYVLENDGRVFDQWTNAIDVCAGLTCTFNGTSLSNGSYQWWMNAWSPGGEGAWDLNPMAFQVTASVPQKVTILSPVSNSTFPAGTNMMQWQHTDTASWYYLKLQSANETIVDGWHDSLDVCTGDLCILDVTLKTGVYSLEMQAWGAGGVSPLSMLSFNAE